MKRYTVLLVVALLAVLAGVAAAQLLPAARPASDTPAIASTSVPGAAAATAPAPVPNAADQTTSPASAQPTSAPATTAAPAIVTPAPQVTVAPRPTPFGPPTTAAPSGDVHAIAPEPGAPGYSPPPGHD